MLKNFIKVVLVSVAVLSSFSAMSKDYVEGKDYKIVSQNKTVEPEVREFFSFFCTHCFSMDETFQKLAKSLEGKAKYVLNPVGIIGGDIGVETQKAYAVGLNKGIANEVKAELFKRIHVLNEKVSDHEFFVDVFNSLGIPTEAYEQDYSSFVTQAKVAEYDRYMDEYKIEAVPEIVVNGKYLVITDNKKNEAEYEQVVNYLLTLK